MWPTGSARRCAQVTWVLLSIWLSGCATASRATTPPWPVASCPEAPTLSPGPVAIFLHPEGGEPVSAHALTDEDWGRLLPYLAGLRICAEQRGETIKAVNGAGS